MVFLRKTINCSERGDTERGSELAVKLCEETFTNEACETAICENTGYLLS